MKRMLGVAAACVLMTLAAAAEDPVTIYYWGNEHDILASDLIHDFENMYDGTDGRPNIRVVMAQSASIDRTSDPQRLLCGIAGGDPPDVVWFDRFAVGEWASKGAFMDLTGFIERDQRERPDDEFTVHKDDYFQPVWEEGLYEGRLYGLPIDADNRAMYYNLDSFERHAEELIEIGCIDPNDPTKVGPPQTWEQLEAATEILTERDEEGELDRVGFIPNFGNSWLYIYGWLNGGQFMSEDGETCTLNSPEIVEALAYMTKLYDLMGGVKEVQAFEISQQGGDLDPFMSGRIAMRIDVAGFLNALANVRRDIRFGVALPPAPEGKTRLGWVGGFAMVIPDGAKHPDEAWEFIRYMVSQRAAHIRAEASKKYYRGIGNVWIPQIHARKDITDWLMEEYLYSEPGIHDRYKDGMRVFVDSMPIAKYRPVTPVGQLLCNAQVRAMDDSLHKKYHPTDLEANAQASLDYHTAIVQRQLDRIFTPPDTAELSWTPIVIAYIIVVVLLIAFGYWYANRQYSVRGYFRNEFYAGYLFAMPWFVGFLVFGGGPLLFSLIMSFCQYDVFHPPRWVGFGNYVEMFTQDPLFYTSLWNTLFMTIRVPLGIAIGLGIAMLLNYEIRGVAIYRTFFFLPSIMPFVAAAILWFWIFNPQEGVLNAGLRYVGLPAPSWLQDPAWSKPAIVLMGLWGAGGGLIIWLAALKGVPQHLYEAAEIDGAGRLRKFWNVTVPMISPYILLNLVMGLIATFQIFTEAYIMTQGGPVNSTLFYAYALFNNAFRYMRMGYASALAWILFFIILSLTLVQLYFSKRWVHYETDR